MQKTVPYQLHNFQEDVLAASQQIPVLVDYWASWCGPCKFLGPIVEKLADEANGKWKLVKVNTEEHSDIATEWGIRGVPNLKLFYKGKVIADLAGAMEEPEMRNWLAEKLPSEPKSMAIEASQLIAKGKTNEGIELLEKAINLDSNLKDARLLLAKLVVWNNPSRIESLVQDIKHLEEAEDLLLLSDFIKGDLLNTKDDKLKDAFINVKSLILKRQIEPAIQLLIEALFLKNRHIKEFARKLIVAIFHTLGESNDLTKKYRRKFDVALY